MIKFVRSLFGINGSSSKRVVAGTNVSFDLQEVAYIKDSNHRLAALLNLYKSYKHTPHADKIKKVYEKTKKIQDYLISKKRIHELEIFHIQNTDNFINAFALIIDVHRRHQESTFTTSEKESEPKPEPVHALEVQASVPKAEAKNGSPQGELFDIAQRVKNRNKQASQIYTEGPGATVPALLMPEISINTIAKIFYIREDALGKPTPVEISFISSSHEKEAFQSYVSARMGVKEIYYVGNAKLNLPNSKSSSHEELVPIIYWGKNLYALTLHDYRMFPVKMYRKTH